MIRAYECSRATNGHGEALGNVASDGVRLTTLVAILLMFGCAVEVKDATAPEPGGDQPIASTEQALQDTEGDVEGFPIDEDGYVAVPGGRVHRSCVHALQEGETLVQEHSGDVRFTRGGATTRSRRACRHPFRPNARTGRMMDPPGMRDGAAGNAAGEYVPQLDGWIEASFTFAFPNAFGFNWFNRLRGDWVVPQEPLNHGGQLVYLFNSLQGCNFDINVCGIIQPVLQFGVNSSNGGGYDWEMASWYVAQAADDGDVLAAVYSPRVAVSWGQTITGTINSTNCNNSGWCTWTIRGQSSSGAWTEFPISLGIPFVRADPAVLESYNLDACNDLPPSTGIQFFNTFLYMPSSAGPNGRFEVFTQSPWTAWQTNVFWPANGTPLCDWGVQPVPPRMVTLYW